MKKGVIIGEVLNFTFFRAGVFLGIITARFFMAKERRKASRLVLRLFEDGEGRPKMAKLKFVVINMLPLTTDDCYFPCLGSLPALRTWQMANSQNPLLLFTRSSGKQE